MYFYGFVLFFFFLSFASIFRFSLPLSSPPPPPPPVPPLFFSLQIS